jgi:beta-galactosidase
MNPPLAGELATIETTWDNINPRVQRRSHVQFLRTVLIDECDGAGCEVGIKQQNPNNPAFGAEYWDNMGTGTRGLAYDYELAFAAPYLDDWRQGRAANAFGMAQWYFAESPGEDSLWAEYQNQPNMVNFVRSSGLLLDRCESFPPACSTTSIRRTGSLFDSASGSPRASLEPCLRVHRGNSAPGECLQQLSVGSPADQRRSQRSGHRSRCLQDQTPNPWNINSSTDLTQNTTSCQGRFTGW